MVDIQTPVLRNRDKPLEERLNENAKEKIIPSRYAKKNSKGTPMEQSTEIFDRVARNVSVAEAVHTDEEVYITPQEIKLDHPRRNQLIEEVFGEEPDEDKFQKVELTEENAKWVSYQQLIKRLDSEGLNETKKKVKEVRDEFRSVMETLNFMPNSPTLMNAGDELQMLSACFVLSPEDDIDDIHDTARKASNIFQAGGGMGYAFWRLRPYGDSVGSTGGIASGPITFMRTYDQMCETIAQGGARRGAQMGIMRVSHPDVLQFIHAKNKDVSLAETLRLNDPDDYRHTSFAEALEEARSLIKEGKVPDHLRNAAEGHLSNFNISVAVTDEFMDAVKNKEDFTFKNPRTGEPHIATPETKELYECYGLGEYVEVGHELSVPAEEIWTRMVEGAHENGEPGVVFIDRINDEHSFDVSSTPQGDSSEYEILATNPCGEQPLMEGEACNLGHINLSTIAEEGVDNWQKYDGDLGSFLDAAIDWEELETRVHVGTRFLDNVVTMSDFPVPEINETTMSNRKIGLGIMGLAQLYVQLGVPYGTDTGNEIAEELMTFINHESKRASKRLAENRGTFDNWEDSKWAAPDRYPDWFEKQTGQDPFSWSNGFPMRNHNTTTIAPTGTTSMVGNTSGGCEPMYNVANLKNVSQDVQGEEMLVQFDRTFLETLEANGYSDEEIGDIKREAYELMQNNEYEGIESLSDVPDEWSELFVTTGDLSAKEHASVQVACQKGVDSAISKTVNAPNESTVDDAKDVFEYIYEHGGKGVTYYRDGTRSKQVLTTRADNQASEEDEEPEIMAELRELVEEGDSALDVVRTLEQEYDEVVEFSKVAGSKTPAKRPDVLDSKSIRVETAYGNMYVMISHYQGRPFEVFATVSKSGAIMEASTEAIARLASTCLRAGVNVNEVIDQLDGIKADQIAWHNGEQISSIADGIAYALRQFMEINGFSDKSDEPSPESEESGTSPTSHTKEETSTSSSGQSAHALLGCPECGAEIIYSEGCEECSSCNWSKC